MSKTLRERLREEAEWYNIHEGQGFAVADVAEQQNTRALLLEAESQLSVLQADAQRKAYPHAAQLLTDYANQMEKELGEEPFHAGGYVVSDRVKELRAAANALSTGQQEKGRG